MQKTEIYDRAMKHYGKAHQFTKGIEEASEWIKELCKNLDGKENLAAVIEETADLEIMIDQVVQYFGIVDEVGHVKSAKLYRLRNRMLEEPEQADNSVMLDMAYNK